MIVIPDLHQIDGELRQPPPTPAHRWTGTEWVFDPDKEAELNQKQCLQFCADVDTGADNARRAVVGDPLRALEYERVAAEANTFKEAGYPADAAPRGVIAWAIGKRTAQQAADDISAEYAAYIEVLYRLREIRLLAKERIRALMVDGDISAAQGIASQAVSDMSGLIVGVGNAAP